MAERHRIRDSVRHPATQTRPDDGGNRVPRGKGGPERADSPSACPGEAAARAADLTEEVRTVAAVLCGAVLELERTADYLADVDRRLQAALSQAGYYHQPGPTVRELAAEVILGHLAALRPFVPTVTTESAERSESELRRGRLGVNAAIKGRVIAS